ncbi:MAG TPA: PAS domain S-box protein, partial [Armatimonadota bacterium]|nr:PAS domain S-box protein [Armatimonadota bacterium]
MGRPDESAEALSGVLRIGPERLASIIEFLPDPTFAIDAKKRVIAWNRACEALTGVHRQTVLGQGDYAYAIPFFGHRRPILIDLLDLPDPETAAGYKYVQRQGDLLYAESFIPRLRDGQGAYVWGVAGPLYDENGHRCGAVEVIRDITERRRIEQALRESEVRYRTLFETASDAILLRRDDRFIDCNPRALALFGCTRDEIIGSTIEALSPPTQPDGVPSADRVRERVQRALHEGP